nr:HipA domain-containing protein [Duncaniella muris]
MTPAYDLLSTSIVMPDDEELALTLNGKKKKIMKADFETAMHDSGMDDKAIANLFGRFSKAIPKWYDLIEKSFLPDEMKQAYRAQIESMAARL